MDDPLRPGIGTRMRARIRGERSAADLEALRAAGAGVYQALNEAEQARTGMLLDGQDLWTAPPAVGGRLVAAWNAFVLQVLAAGLLDADYATDSGTVGYVPPVTFNQVWSWFAAATGWLSQAHQAAANPDYDLTDIVGIPADLPAWAHAEPCPPAHLHALLTAVAPIRERAELAVFDLDQHATTEDRQAAVNGLRQLAAEAATSAGYAQTLGATPAGERLHGLIETHLKRAMTLWFHIGQLAAVPALIDRYRAGSGPVRLDPDALPGGSRFDPWCLTDPGTRGEWQEDAKARKAIAALWAADPDPAHTLTIHAEIQAALTSRAISRVSGGRHGTYHYCCPWSPIYQVRRPVTIGGQQLSAAQQFTFDVSGEKVAEVTGFVRRILLGPFHATSDIDYCDPP